MPKWDNVERRKSFMNGEDHDLLIKINQNIDNLLSNFNVHVAQDSIDLKETKGRLGGLEKIVWMGMGALAVLNIILKLVK